MSDVWLPPLFIARRENLLRHPKNIRRMYPQKALDEMARSLAAYSQTHETGNQSALHVTLAEGSEPTFRQDQSTGMWYLVTGEFYAVDGNIRFLAGGILKDQCPPFKCEPMSGTEAEQWIEMSVSTVRFEVDPISEALHYQRLRDEIIIERGVAKNLSLADIARLTGKSLGHVTNRIELLELDEAIQILIAEDKLHSDARVAKALRSIPDSKARVKLAERLAGEGASIKAIEDACRRVVEGLETRARGREREKHPQPMRGNAEGKAGRRIESDDVPAPWSDIRGAAAAACAGCEIKQRQLQDVAEPMWYQVAHTAGQVCDNCNVRTLPGACQSCPGVELLKRLILNVASGAVPAVPMVSDNGTHTTGNGSKSSAGR